MTTADASRLTVRLQGPGWRVELAVDPPDPSRARLVSFEVPAGPDGAAMLVNAELRYTTARNMLADGWGSWHVKVYQCATVGETEELRRHLHRQATDVMRANEALPRPGGPFQPPWAVAPVVVVSADGLGEIGQVHTQLGIAAGDLLDRVPSTVPDWYGDPTSTPERYLLAFSPYLDPVHWPAFHTWPATEYLPDFAAVAAGLDALHRRGVVHGDVKPDNLCRYASHLTSAFALVDTDSAHRLSAPFTTVRLTRRYAYPGLVRWLTDRLAADGSPPPGLLLAHDRRGFALVVLCVLAGRDWVDTVLLGATDDGTGESDIAGALRRHWVDTADRDWRPLIAALAEAFGPAVEAPSWSLATWLERVRDTERKALVPGPPAPGAPDAVVDRYRRDLDEIRATARAMPSTRPERVRVGAHAVRQQAERVAARAAWRRSLLLAVVTRQGLVRRLDRELGAFDAERLGYRFAEWLAYGGYAPLDFTAEVEGVVATRLDNAAQIGAMWGTRVLLAMSAVLVLLGAAGAVLWWVVAG